MSGMASPSPSLVHPTSGPPPPLPRRPSLPQQAAPVTAAGAPPRLPARQPQPAIPPPTPASRPPPQAASQPRPATPIPAQLPSAAPPVPNRPPAHVMPPSHQARMAPPSPFPGNGSHPAHAGTQMMPPRQYAPPYNAPSPMSASATYSATGPTYYQQTGYTPLTTPSNSDDESLTAFLKETSKDYIKGLGQSVTQILTPQDKPEPTEEEKRAAREREKEMERKEAEYIEEQRRRVLEEDRRRAAAQGPSPQASKSVPSTNAPAGPSSHQNHITFNLSSNMKKEFMGQTFTVYVIDVTWNDCSWTVYRRYKQFHEFSSQAKKASYTFAHSLPPKKRQGNLKDEFVEQRQRELQVYVQAVNAKVHGMLANKKARIALLRFFAPTQVGDKRNSGGALPFDLGELVG